MAPTITLAIPEAPARSDAQARARRTTTARGVRLGILDNSKPNAELLLRGLLDRIAASTRLESVLYLSKPNAAINAPSEVLDQLEEGADVVFSAMAD